MTTRKTDENILTAEWAIARLQAEGTQQLQVLRDRENPSAADELKEDEESASKIDTPSAANRVTMAEKEEARAPPMKIGRYHCIFAKQHGKLCLGTDQASFETTLPPSEKWSLRYEDMRTVSKVIQCLIHLSLCDIIPLMRFIPHLLPIPLAR